MTTAVTHIFFCHVSYPTVDSLFSFMTFVVTVVSYVQQIHLRTRQTTSNNKKHFLSRLQLQALILETIVTKKSTEIKHFPFSKSFVVFERHLH